MDLIKQYNEARLKYERRYEGLPHCYTTLLKTLLSMADPKTGVVKGVTYHELAETLSVAAAPGRKQCGIPEKQTIRNYIKAIQKACSDDFKVISEGQELRIAFLKFADSMKPYLEGCLV